jgi:uncharacterized surface protein with fasciclin (FAS1) repeats
MPTSMRKSMGRTTRILGALVVVALLGGACGDDDDAGGPTVEEARERFCDASADRVAALDRYGRLFDDTAVTVGDVRSSGEDLAAGREEVEAAADELRAAIEAAEDGTAEDEAGEDEAGDDEAGGTVTSTTAPTVAVSEEAIARLEDAENVFGEVLAEVDEDTPLAEAAVEVSSAAYRLQVAWQIVLAQAGCIENLEEALGELLAYVEALQTDLTTAGFYDGPIDGIYGPRTVDAVAMLQETSGLPVTGVMDRATQAALAELLAGRAAAQVTALQGLLTGLGYWNGPIDGVWTDELGLALATLQGDLGLEPSGTMDIATLRAVQEALAAGTADPAVPPPPTTPPTTAPEPGTTSTTTAPPAETERTVIDVLEDDGRFTTLVGALDAAGLTEVLAGEGLFTLFAPTDAAFAALPAGELDALLADPAALSSLLGGHTVDGAAMLADFLLRAGAVPSAAGTPLTITAGAADAVVVNGATVTTADLAADNGVVHVVDAVLVVGGA